MNRNAAGIKGGIPVRVYTLVPIGEEDERLVVLAEFQDRYARRDLRELLASLRREVRTSNRFPDRTGLKDTLFIVATPGYDDVRFVLFEEQERRIPRIRSFGWERENIGRTVLTHNLERLQWPPRKEWDSAWDIEALTDKFFDHYRDVFRAVEDSVTEVAGDKRLFVQRLFNRLLFIQFLSRKGWLEFGGSKEYLSELFRAAVSRGENFYKDRLYWAFFHGLGTLEDSKPAHSLKELEERRGRVPFLNGGLFEMVDSDDVQGAVAIPNESFRRIIEELFGRWNFTITESTPLDIDVAVDPEMLGKVFEELVTGRHETGSYYTPRPVVAFMCREALKGYLGGFEKLVDEHDTSGIGVDDAKALIKKLESIRVCDPACGSGAYLLGMLQEIHALQYLLDTTAHQRTARDDYMRKVTIIENCLYGVDIDPFAVNIAWLRLWLALVIDNPRNPLKHPDDDVSLPNLDVKIGVGDSLLAPDPHSLLVEGQLTLVKPLIEEYRREKGEYMRAHSKRDKDRLRAAMVKTRGEIRGFVNGVTPVGSFDWAVDFVEVFVDESGNVSGFDSVLANPPYVRADAQFKHLLPDKAAQKVAIAAWNATRAELVKSKIYETLWQKWDLFIPFLERAHQLLDEGGDLIFIISDAYNGNKYAQKSHAYFIARSSVDRIDFCSEIPLFKAGVFNTIVHFSRRTPAESHEPIRVRRWGNKPDEFETNCDLLVPVTQAEARERLFRPLSERNETSYGESIPLAHLCYISVGAVLHANEKTAHEAFKLEDVISQQPDAKHPKRLFLGRNMGSWTITESVWLEYGTDRAPSLFRRPTFPELYEVPQKLVSMRIVADSPRVIRDDQQCWHNHTAFSFVPWHYLKGVRNKSISKTAKYKSQKGKRSIALWREELERVSATVDIAYLHGILNSRFARDWMSRERRSKLDVYSEDWKQFPVKVLAPNDQRAITQIVNRIVAAKKQDPNADVSELETNLNERVDFLYYYRTGNETYDEWIARREAERGTAVEGIRILMERVEDQTLEFKESVIWDVRQDKYSAVMRDEVLKEICAFLNADGGTVLCGVHDKEGLKGLRKDLKFKGGKDELGRVITSALGDLLRPHPVELVKMEFVDIDSETVLRIDVTPDPANRYESPSVKPADQGKNIPRTHVRIHGTAEALEGQALINWWDRRRKA